jgi:aminoglycoside phosphotransferase (APT) family kinase protein
VEGAGPDHGLADDPGRALRLAEPPARALAWVVDAVHGVAVAGCAPLVGGITSAMHRVSVRHRGGAHQEVVLRRYVHPEVLADEPDAVEREATALALAARNSLPTPGLVATDPTAAATDVPALLMTALDGRVIWPTAERPWAHCLAELAASIGDVGAITSAERGQLPSCRPYRQRSYEPPPWADDAAVWERAVAHVQELPPPGSAGFIHRDFHPGNLLWTGDRCSGVVDWQWACTGPPSVDIGHCRLNLLVSAPHVADALAVAWQEVTGRPYERWADVLAIVGVLDGLRAQQPTEQVRAALEGALAAALADLEG